MTLREKLIVLRDKAGISQMTLAHQLGVSRQAVSRWESGDATPSMDKLKALAKIYGVSLDWLGSDASDAGALVQEKNLDERDPVCNSELPTEDKPKKRKKWAIIIGVIIVGVLLSAYVVLSKKAGSFLSTAKQIDDLEEENVENAPESGFEFDWQGECGNVKKCAVGKHPKSEKLGSTGQAACCARIHSRYFTGGSPSGLRV